MTKIPDRFKHFIWGDNQLFFPHEEFIIKLSYPRLFVRFDSYLNYSASFEEFINSIAETHYLDGKRPPEKEHLSIMTDVWNFLALSERQLEDDLADNEIDEHLGF